MKVVWNAIVKNEQAIIDRCVNSLLPHIDGAVIVDTGSTDGTPEKLQQLFAQAGKPIEISPAPFENFEQARNEALRCARISRMEWDYLLLVDADMELKVGRQPWLNGEKGLSYDVKQTAGSLGYYNRRLVSRHADGWYIGVTHEYLDVASAGTLDGVEFIDHADGTNRPGKIPRDIELLEKALKTETRDGLIQRYTFYLAGSHYDLCNWQQAAFYYANRTAMGGFDEEVWYAQYRYAMCMQKRGYSSVFVAEMLKAWQLRPSRIEPLYELAKYYRERGDNHASLLFSEAGLALPHSKDQLFVNDWVYRQGLREEFAICGYYSDRHRYRAARECNKLSLEGSDQARSNMFWYLQSLQEHVPSFQPERIAFTPPEGWVATNPSVINCESCGGKPLFLVRTVNYTITPEGRYAVRGADGDCSPDNPINTRNYLVNIRAVVESYRSYELKLPRNWPSDDACHLYKLVRGFEDSRLFRWNDKLWTSSTVRELNPEGWCEQVLAAVMPDTSNVPELPKPIGPLPWRYTEWLKILPKERHHEKNWMPWVKDGELRFVYRLGTLIDIKGDVVFDHPPDFDVSNISGGSQVVQLDERTWIALVHEAGSIPGRTNRYYQHRFVSFRPNGAVDRISPPFCFHDRQIEFAAGLAYFPQQTQLMVSYGVRDCEAWYATMHPDEVLAFIYKDTL